MAYRKKQEHAHSTIKGDRPKETEKNYCSIMNYEYMLHQAIFTRTLVIGSVLSMNVESALQ